MANLRNVRINPETGEVSYFFPMELTPETKRDFRELIEHKHYEVGWGMLGHREFEAVFIPVSRAEYYDLIRDELRAQDEAKIENRCVISNGRGGTRLCPLKVDNPDYVEGGNAPRYIMVRCEECPYSKSFSPKKALFVSFEDLTVKGDDDDLLPYDAAAPLGYFAGEFYEERRQQFLDFVRCRKPRCVALAECLTDELCQKEAAEELKKATTTVNAQVKILRDLLTEFLNNTSSVN